MEIREWMPGETGREYALRMIKINIINLGLLPGSKVSETGLAQELNLSRTPVREALIALGDVGLIQNLPQRSGCVALIDLQLVEQARFMRATLEKAVVAEAAEKITGEDLERLRKHVEFFRFYAEHDDPLLRQSYGAFHRDLFSIAGKSWVYDYISNMSIHFDRLRHMSRFREDNAVIVEDLNEIIGCLERRDGEGAARTMERHLMMDKRHIQAVRERYPDYFKK